MDTLQLSLGRWFKSGSKENFLRTEDEMKKQIFQGMSSVTRKELPVQFCFLVQINLIRIRNTAKLWEFNLTRIGNTCILDSARRVLMWCRHWDPRSSSFTRRGTQVGIAHTLFLPTIFSFMFYLFKYSDPLPYPDPEGSIRDRFKTMSQVS